MPGQSGAPASSGERILRNLEMDRSRFMEDFQPENSRRERRKRRLDNAGAASNALYDDKGFYIDSGRDLCDCLSITCPGCHFMCRKCKSPKCGAECRVGRTWDYEQVSTQSINSTNFVDTRKNVNH